jgi:predicted metal-dependent HD superfamily phosphohydrolase
MEKLLQETDKYLTQLLSQQNGQNFLFHNLDHTKKIIDRTYELLEAEKSDTLHKNEVLIAAWFMNSGYIKDYNDPVTESCALAESFLSEKGVDDNKIKRIRTLIQIAWNDNGPTNKEEEIIKDARTSFYAADDLEELLGLLRMEMENLNQNPPGIQEWRKRYIETLRTRHRFYTDHAKENWQEQKDANVLDLIGSTAKVVKTKKKEKLKAKLKDERPGRAIQSLYRIQLRNHIKLSDIADTKANILLSVNAIIISLLLANLIPKLGVPSNSYLIYPTAIFVVCSIASMIMSVMATRPKIENKDVVEKEIMPKDTNFLFFGTFHSMKPQDFKEKLREIRKDTEKIYDSLTMDLYYLGKVLQKKYQLLRWTYTVFIVGIILSVLAFAIALKYFGMEEELLKAVTPDIQEN